MELILNLIFRLYEEISKIKKDLKIKNNKQNPGNES